MNATTLAYLALAVIAAYAVFAALNYRPHPCSTIRALADPAPGEPK